MLSHLTHVTFGAYSSLEFVGKAVFGQTEVVAIPDFVVDVLFVFKSFNRSIW